MQHTKDNGSFHYYFFPLSWKLYVTGRPNHSAPLSYLLAQYPPLLTALGSSKPHPLPFLSPNIQDFVSFSPLLLSSTSHILYLVLFKTNKAVIQQQQEKRFDKTHLLLRPCWPGSFILLFLPPVSCSNKSSATLKAINTEMMWMVTSLDNSKDFQ